MNNQTNNTGNPFMEAVTKQIEKQDEKIAGLNERIKNIPDHSEDFEQVKKDLIELKAIVRGISFPAKEMRELSANL